MNRRELMSNEPAQGVRRETRPTPAWRYIQFIVLGLTVAMLVSEAFLYVPLLQPKTTLSVEIEEQGGSISVTSRLWSSYAGSYRQVYSWGPGTSQVNTLYYYFDLDYPRANVSHASWVGFPFHLQEIIDDRGLLMRVAIVNAKELQSVLMSTSIANRSLLVMASGAFPDTVFTNRTNLVTPWIQQGGTLLWIGAPIGYYVAEPGVQLCCPSPPSPGLAGVAQFVNLSLLGGPQNYYDSTTASTALNMRFTSGLSGYGFNITSLRLSGGVEVGNQAEGHTNGAVMTFGAGLIIDLVGEVLTPVESEISVSIVNMIQLGFTHALVELVGYRDIAVNAGEVVTWSERVPVGSAPRQRFCVLTHQTDLTAFFGSATCL